jgi:hypothetical protein
LRQVNLVVAWLRAFALTTLIELGVAFPLLGRKEQPIRRVGAIVLGQLATHPLVWFVWPELGLGRGLYLVVAESWAVLVELLVYWLVFSSIKLQRAAAISLVANAVSFGIGLLLHRF